MTSLETTELKLKSTPTGGKASHESPLYRKLVSVGYKGFLQGSIGGGSLYGALGLLIGGLVAIAAAPVLGLQGFFIVPAAFGIGVIKGASTFGSIGSVAAINAESADLSEQRRYLLDRYYDLPEGPEGAREAAAIKQELLSRQQDLERAPQFFHWKTVIVGALIGAGLAFVAFSPVGFGVLGLGSALSHLGLGMLFTGGSTAAGAAAAGVAAGTAAAGAAAGTAAVGAGVAAAATAAATASASTAALTTIGVGLGTLAGALTGATIGIDRYYIRKWFDHTQNIIHSGTHGEAAVMERIQQIERLKAAAKVDEQTKAQLSSQYSSASTNSVAATAPQVETPVKPLASLDSVPSTKIRDAVLQSRLIDVQKAMNSAAI
ncbi:MAG: hypothetical protein ACOYNL_00995 [Rickettsiales bacterium]